MNFYALFAMALLIAPIASLNAHVREIKTLAQYNKLFNSERPMITMYSGTYCGPCKMMKPHFKKVALGHPDIEFCIIDTSNPTLKRTIRQLNIRSLPTVICTHKGEKILTEASGGLQSDEIEEMVTKFRDVLKKRDADKKAESKKQKESSKQTESKQEEAKKKIAPKIVKKEKPVLASGPKSKEKIC